MREPLKIPDDCLRYVLWQRAGCRSPLVRPFVLVGRNTAKNFYMKYIAGSWFERRRIHAISQKFSADIERTLGQIKDHLPSRCERILDIGCGIGGIDVALAHHINETRGASPQLWMFDKDDDSPMEGRHYAGFRENPAAYNTLHATGDFLEANGVPAERYRLVETSRDGFPRGVSFDVIVSLLSWGFHYPVDTYLDDVIQALSPDGVLFVDIRAGTDGIGRLQSVFKDVSVLDRGSKRLLVCARNLR